jgi:hypothetical protein
VLVVLRKTKILAAENDYKLTCAWSTSNEEINLWTMPHQRQAHEDKTLAIASQKCDILHVCHTCSFFIYLFIYFV